MKALSESIEEVKKADSLIVLGSSLTVYPAAILPSYTIENGGSLMIVNDMPTSYDPYATLKYTDLKEVFEYLENQIDRGTL